MAQGAGSKAAPPAARKRAQQQQKKKHRAPKKPVKHVAAPQSARSRRLAESKRRLVAQHGERSETSAGAKVVEYSGRLKLMHTPAVAQAVAKKAAGAGKGKKRA